MFLKIVGQLKTQMGRKFFQRYEYFYLSGKRLKKNEQISFFVE